MNIVHKYNALLRPKPARTLQHGNGLRGEIFDAYRGIALL